MICLQKTEKKYKAARSKGDWTGEGRGDLLYVHQEMEALEIKKREKM